MGRGKMLSANDDLRAGRGFDVAQPIGVAAKRTHDDRLGAGLAIFQHLQDGMAEPTGAAPRWIKSKKRWPNSHPQFQWYKYAGARKMPRSIVLGRFGDPGVMPLATKPLRSLPAT